VSLNPECPLFSNVCASLPKRRSLYASVVFHGLVLAWILHSPTPTFVSPSPVLQGENGRSLTQIYWTKESAGAEQRTLEKDHLIWRTVSKTKPQPKRPDDSPAKGPEDTAISASKVDNGGPTAGNPYGSLSYGSVVGLEVRPATRVFGSEPRVDADDLVGLSEGNEIVEITVDAQGNIVDRVIVQSLGPAVDAKVIAALADWHFRPATRDGAAIASKQDVYYHFPLRH
jgi:TonB family protein